MHTQRWLRATWQSGRLYLWMPALVWAIHLMANSVFAIYRRFPPFDIPMHLMGGLAIAYLFAGALKTLERERLLHLPEEWVRWLLLFALVCTATAFWEFAEWISDHMLGSTCQLGLDDTLFDMVCGLLGGCGFLMAQACRKSPAVCGVPVEAAEVKEER